MSYSMRTYKHYTCLLQFYVLFMHNNEIFWAILNKIKTQTRYDLCHHCFVREDEKTFVDDVEDPPAASMEETFQQQQLEKICCYSCLRKLGQSVIYFTCEKNADENLNIMEHLVLCESCHVQLRELQKFPDFDMIVKDVHISPDHPCMNQIEDGEKVKLLHGYYPRCSLMKMCLDVRLDNRNKRDPRDSRLVM
ncbi:hypothetical protein RFI_07316, partial [Reticulomyxa filosa]